MALRPERPGPPEPESRYFKPTVRCPNPERWSSTDGNSTEIEVSEFVGAIVRAVQPEFVVETGSGWGQTSEAIGRALLANGHGRLVTIESDNESAIHVRQLMYSLGLPVSVVEGSSMDWVPQLGSPSIGVLFCDTARDQRVDEILHFASFLIDGAIIAVHDSAWDAGPLRGWLENSLVKPGIARAIDFPTPRGLTLLQWLVVAT